jgi:hypothetical protein
MLLQRHYTITATTTTRTAANGFLPVKEVTIELQACMCLLMPCFAFMHAGDDDAQSGQQLIPVSGAKV